jgi:hypothetical protein
MPWGLICSPLNSSVQHFLANLNLDGVSSLVEITVHCHMLPEQAYLIKVKHLLQQFLL